MSGKRVLAVDSSWDSATKLAAAYRAQHVYPYLKKRYRITRLEGPMAIRVHFQMRATRADVVFLTAMGHGSETEFTGDGGRPILQVATYSPSEVQGRIIHLLSCKTAGRLGPDLVKNGALAFFGYSEDFVFKIDVADAFFECDSEIDFAIADRLKANDVYQRVQAVFEAKIDELASRDGLAAALLNANLRYLCSPKQDKSFGSPSAKLT